MITTLQREFCSEGISAYTGQPYFNHRGVTISIDHQFMNKYFYLLVIMEGKRYWKSIYPGASMENYTS